MQSGEGYTAQKSVVYFSNFFRVRLAWSQLWASIKHLNQSMIAPDLFDSMVECHRILSFCGHHCYPQQYAPALFWSWCLFVIRIKDVIMQQDSLYTVYGWLHEAQTACRARRWFILMILQLLAPYANRPFGIFCGKNHRAGNLALLRTAVLFSCLMKSISLTKGKTPCSFRLLDQQRADI